MFDELFGLEWSNSAMHDCSFFAKIKHSYLNDYDVTGPKLLILFLFIFKDFTMH